MQRKIPNALRKRPEDAELLLPIPANAEGFYGVSIDDRGRYQGSRHLGSVEGLCGPTWLYVDTLKEGDKFSMVSRRETPSAAARARADEIIAAHRRLVRRYNRKPPGYRLARRAAHAAESKTWGLFDKILETRAQTLDGILEKIRLSREIGLEDDGLAETLTADLLVMAEARS